MASVLNISAYLFTALDDCAALRPVLRARADAAGLKGTILLAEEGINLFLAGEPDCGARLRRRAARGSAIRGAHHEGELVRRSALPQDARQGQARDHPDGPPDDPARRRCARPRSPRRPCAGGSTRAATTRGAKSCCSTPATRSRSTTAPSTGALDWRIERFTQFPDAAAARRADLEGKTVVSFCTGGIRCEKAALYLGDLGVDALQLDGGILGYFEQVGSDHFTGECFVFDEREALTPALAATDRSGDGRSRPSAAHDRRLLRPRRRPGRPLRRDRPRQP